MKKNIINTNITSELNNNNLSEEELIINDVINDILNVLTLLGLVKVEKRQIEKDNYAIFVTAISNTIEKTVFIE